MTTHDERKPAADEPGTQPDPTPSPLWLLLRVLGLFIGLPVLLILAVKLLFD